MSEAVFSVVGKRPQDEAQEACVKALEEWLALAKAGNFVSVAFIGVGYDRRSVTGLTTTLAGFSDNMLSASTKLMFRINSLIDETSITISQDSEDDGA